MEDSGSGGSFGTFTRPGKAQITGDQIAPGAVSLVHLDPGLYEEIRKIALHGHTGVGSVQVKIQDLDGSLNQTGFQIRDSAGKIWTVTVSTGGSLVVS